MTDGVIGAMVGDISGKIIDDGVTAKRGLSDQWRDAGAGGANGLVGEFLRGDIEYAHHGLDIKVIGQRDVMQHRARSARQAVRRARRGESPLGGAPDLALGLRYVVEAGEARIEAKSSQGVDQPLVGVPVGFLDAHAVHKP